MLEELPAPFILTVAPTTSSVDFASNDSLGYFQVNLSSTVICFPAERL